MRVLLRCLCAAALLTSGMARAQTPPEQPLTLELNKLESVPASAGGGGDCRAYIVATDPEGGAKVDALRLDLVLFGTDGVIARRIALDVGPIQPGRTQVRPFELRDLPCDSIGQILINDTMLCKLGGTDYPDCMDRLRTSSRVSAKLTK